MVNWESNVFPGILGRTCDRPCEPACRRGRVDEEPVAICRLKRVAADNKDQALVKKLVERTPTPNGKKIALIGGGPASLTVARDLAPLGYEIHLYDEWNKGGGMMRTQIPSFRLPETVLDEEVNYILDMGRWPAADFLLFTAVYSTTYRLQYPPRSEIALACYDIYI